MTGVRECDEHVPQRILDAPARGVEDALGDLLAALGDAGLVVLQP